MTASVLKGTTEAIRVVVCRPDGAHALDEQTRSITQPHPTFELHATTTLIVTVAGGAPTWASWVGSRA